jgi:hypothetical protein
VWTASARRLTADSVPRRLFGSLCTHTHTHPPPPARARTTHLFTPESAPTLKLAAHIPSYTKHDASVKKMSENLRCVRVFLMDRKESWDFDNVRWLCVFALLRCVCACVSAVFRRGRDRVRDISTLLVVVSLSLSLSLSSSDLALPRSPSRCSLSLVTASPDTSVFFFLFFFFAAAVAVGNRRHFHHGANSAGLTVGVHEGYRDGQSLQES